jgi:biotin carboxylase
MIDCCIESTLGEEVKWQRTKENGSAIRFIFAEDSDDEVRTIKSIEGVEDALKMPDVEEIVMYKAPGDKAERLKNSGDRLGHVIATGKDADEAARNAESALARIHIEYV